MLEGGKANHFKKRICFITVSLLPGVHRINFSRYKWIEKLQMLKKIKKSKSTIGVTKRSVFGINSGKVKENLTSVFETL